MADETKKVEYQFTGDVSSLQKATEGAIKLLDQYQAKITDLTKANAYTPNQRVAKSMQTAIAGTMKEIDKLQKKFQSVQDVKLFKDSPEYTRLAGLMQNLQDQVNTFGNKTKVTTADVKALTAAMRDAKKGFADAGPAVDQLVTKEERLQARLEAIRTRSEAMANAMRAGVEKVTGPLRSLATPLDAASNKMAAFKAKAAEALDHVKRYAEAAGSGFRQFKGDSEDAAASHSRLGQILNNIKSKFSKESAAVKDEDSKLQKKNKTLKSSQGAHNRLISAVIALGNNIKKETKNIINFANSMKDATKSSNLMGKALNAAIFEKIGEAIASATTKSIEYIENLNLFTVAMGESIDEATKFVDRMTEIYGMDPSNIYRHAGYFYQLTDAIGATSEASKIMSLSLTKAANDISSLFNTDIETVVNDLASGMQGMSRAVRKYGIDIRQTTLQQTALAYGFQENVSTTSEANRQALRYLTIMGQVKNATKQVTSTVDGATTTMGDFARNIETPANQLRILKEQASQVARAFGNFFIPVMQKVLYVVNGVLMAIKTLLTFLATLAGIDIGGFGGEVSKGADEAAGSVGGIGDAADKTAKKLKNLITPFDELTILSEPKDTGSAGGGGIGGDILDPGLAEALKNMQLGLDEIRMKALDVRDKILELLGLEFDGSEITVTIGGFIDDLIHLWDAADYTGFGERIAEFLNQGVEWGIQHTDPSKYAPILNQKVQMIAQILNGLVGGFNWEGLGTIIGNGITIALNGINTFLTTFDWNQLGAALASGLNGIIYAVDWELLGQTIANYFMAKIQAIQGFLDTFDWTTLGQSLGTGFTNLINTVNWDDLGTLLASAVNGLLALINGFFDTFDWNQLGAALASGLNGIVYDVDWELLGQTIADYFMATIQTIQGFLDTFDWTTLGQSLGTGFTNLINTVNWDDLGTLLASAVNDLLDLINGFCDTYEWGTLGTEFVTGFNTAIHEINWDNLGGTVSDVLIGLVTEVKDAVTTLDWLGVSQAIMDFLKNIDWLKLLEEVVETVMYTLASVVLSLLYMIDDAIDSVGTYIADGFKDGILDGLANIGEWLYDHLVQPVIDAVKDFFGIHSPSTVFADIGGNLISGMFEGITDMVGDAGSWIKEHLCDPIINGAKKAFGIVGGIASTFKNIGGDLLAGMFSGLSNIGTKVADWGQNILNKVKGVFGIHSPSKEFEDIGNYMTSGLFKGVEDTKEIQETYSNMLKAMQAKTKEFVNNATKQFKSMADSNTQMLNSANTQQQQITNNITSMFSTMATRASNSIQTIINKLNSIPRNISTTHTITTSNVVNNSADNMRRMATGGVVRGPTRALIGEGRYDEAVIPLGNSPELAEMIDKIANAVSATPRVAAASVAEDRERPIVVHVYLDGEEITTRQNRTNRMYGRTQQNI